MCWPTRSSVCAYGGGHPSIVGLPVGVTETRGVWWSFRFLGHHTWSLAPPERVRAGVVVADRGHRTRSRTGRVRLCVVDPKGGMELGVGAPMFTVFSHDATHTTLQLLRALVDLMHARANRLRGHTRLHTPTTTDPLSWWWWTRSRR